MARIAVVLVLVVLAACGGEDLPPEQYHLCKFPLVVCEGDPNLCPVPGSGCRQVISPGQLEPDQLEADAVR